MIEEIFIGLIKPVKMKALNLIAWAAAGVGVLLILLAVISEFSGATILFLNHINYFNAANSFFLIGIFLLVYMIRYQGKKE